MPQFFEVHPDNPQPRLLKQAAALLQRGGIAAVPTDSSYALVCHLDDKAAADALRRIRGVDDKQFRMLKAATPGPFTFILDASKEVPRRVSHPTRKTIGLRMPDHKALQALLELHGAPLLSTTLIAPGANEPLNDADEIRSAIGHELAAIVDAGACFQEPTTVVDLTAMGDGGEAVVVRLGRGNPALLGL
jgi:tRNA threonylcarbamoyl adenosine modification protein (Sua5/YciO/YrdC/YwlC family)